MRVLLTGMLIAGAANAGYADSSVAVTPGRQASPPGPAQPAPGTLAPNDGQRRAVSGCTVGNDCRSPEELLLEFELEAFPSGGASSPWIDSDDPLGHGVAHRTDARHANDPLALRPDLPWLAELELPDIPVTWDHRLIRYLEFYKNDPRGKSIMAAWLRDQGKYRDMILQHLRKAKLPDDLLYVCMIESSYNPREYSRVGAAGLWQFMPGTGKVYGLTISRWVDNRYDPELSTIAATMMWADLFQRFGDWHLALAAYNAGYGNVLRAISKYNTNDFWQLLEYESALPWGSHIYVAKALAAAIVGHNRELFGLHEIPNAAPITFDRVTVSASVSLDIIARAAGTDQDTIKRLNPHVRRGRTPPGIHDFVVRIPAGRSAQFAERFAQLRGDWDKYDAYVVSHGERFEDIATVHGISQSKLAALNGIDDEAEVRGGSLLVVPRTTEEQKQHNRKAAEDALYAGGVPGGEPGDALIVPVLDKDHHKQGKRDLYYRVVSGDSLWQIAELFGVTVAELSEWNGLSTDTKIHPRMVMQVWVAPDYKPADSVKLLDEQRIILVTTGSVEHMELSEGRIGRRRATYTVKSGGTLEDVGKKYGLTKYDMARINRLPPNTRLEQGAEVIVYELVDASKSRKAARQQQRLRPKKRKRRGK